MSSSLPAVPPLRSPGGWLLLLPAHLAALLQAFLAACRQHPEQGVPPGWLPVPAGAPLAAVRQAVRRACWQAGVPWLWLVVRPAGGQPRLAALAEQEPYPLLLARGEEVLGDVRLEQGQVREACEHYAASCRHLAQTTGSMYTRIQRKLFDALRQVPLAEWDTVVEMLETAWGPP